MKKTLALAAALCAACMGTGVARAATAKAETGFPDTPLYAPAEVVTDRAAMEAVIERAGRDWQGGAPGIARTRGGRLFACLFSGGENEPQPENYAIFMYSDDDGRTWVDPFLIVAHPHPETRVTDPSVQVDSLGRLWLCWNQQYPVPGESLYGWWSVRIDDPDAPIEEVVRAAGGATPVRNYDGVRINKFIERKNGEWIQPIAVTGGRYIYFLASADKGDTWTLRGTVYGGGEWVGEPCVAEKDDGTLWLLTRYGYAVATAVNGGVGQSFSTDGGKYWSEMQGSLPAPLTGVSSRLYFGRLKSGAYVFITNDAVDARRNLTVYLSYDGETWPYSLLLDGREGADGGYMGGPSYPDLAEDDQGNIYVVWDFGRYNEKEMRLSIFTEADIKAGAFVSENARDKLVVSKLGPYADIVSVETEFPRSIAVGPDNAAAEAKALLPTTIAVTDERGQRHELSGGWSIRNFIPDRPGEYEMEFTLKSDDPALSLLKDTYGLLGVSLTVESPARSRGCGAAAGGAAGGAAGAALALGGVCAALKKRGGESA